MSRRRRRQEEEENHERWLVSYADFITLLFAFFVVMYAISSLNEGKYRVLSATLTDAFKDRSTTNRGTPIGVEVGGALVELPEVARDPGVIPGQDPGSKVDRQRAELPEANAQEVRTSEPQQAVPQKVESEARPETQPEGTDEAFKAKALAQAQAQAKSTEQLARLATALRQSLGDLIKDDLAHVTFNQRWVEVNLDSKILFESASANLHQEVLRALSSMSQVLRVVPNEISVEGHTDNIPISTREYPSNWELSSARAASVVHFMARQGLDPGRLSAVGMGEHRPLADNSTPEGRATNRRVRLLIMALPAPASASAQSQTQTQVPAAQQTGEPRP